MSKRGHVTDVLRERCGRVPPPPVVLPDPASPVLPAPRRVEDVQLDFGDMDDIRLDVESSPGGREEIRRAADAVVAKLACGGDV